MIFFLPESGQRVKLTKSDRGDLLGSMTTLSKFHDCEIFLHEYLFLMVVVKEQSRVIKNIRFSWLCGS